MQPAPPIPAIPPLPTPGPSVAEANAPAGGTTPGAAAAAGAAGDKPAPMPVTSAEYRATAILFGIFVVNILLAVLFARPFFDAGLQAFKNPEEVSNSIWYIVMILAFTAGILYLAKKGHKWLIQAVILFAVGSTIAYVVAPLLLLDPISLSASWAWGIGVAFAAVGTVALWKHPEWYVIDGVGLVVAAGAASIFGISLGVLPVIFLLVALAVYDAIAVYKTKHMLALADSVIELRLPVLLVIPKHRGYHFRKEAGQFKQASAANKGEREAMFMGLGDLVMPTILVVSALVFLPGALAIERPLLAEFDDGDDPPTGAAAIYASTDPAFVDSVSGLQGGELGPEPTNGTVRVFFVLAGQADANWTLDWDRDADVDLTGSGLPALRTVYYEQPGLYEVRLSASNATDASRQDNATLDAAIQHPPGPWYQSLEFLLHHPPALGAAIGTLVGFGVLMGFVLRGNPQAGLPLLNGGSIVGFLVGLWYATGSIVFW